MNEYFKTFILPMNRVQYKLLAENITELNQEKNPFEKGKKIADKFGMFMEACGKDMEEIQPIYDEMKENILKYINYSEGPQC